jgi:hypothetical protein
MAEASRSDLEPPGRGRTLDPATKAPRPWRLDLQAIRHPGVRGGAAASGVRRGRPDGVPGDEPIEDIRRADLQDLIARLKPPGGAAVEGAPARGEEPGNELAQARRAAAERRVRLRGAEAENERRGGVVAGLQRGQVEALAAERLVRPADLFESGVELGDVLADDTSVDSDRVTEAVQRLVSERPHYARPGVDFGAGPRGSR